MKTIKKLSIFVILFLVVSMMLTTVAFAAAESSEMPNTEMSGKLDKDMSGKDMTFGERLEYVLQGTITGMLMVFAVLGMLWGIISVSKVVFYDIPNKKKEKELKKRAAKAPITAPIQESDGSVIPEINESGSDEGELAAVITAAIAAMIESGDYKDEFVGGFKVVSFKRSAKTAWNRK